MYVLLIFTKIILLLLSNFIIIFYENYFCFIMFRDVRRCSGMFPNVPCFRFYRRPFQNRKWKSSTLSRPSVCKTNAPFKVARYSFLGWIPPTFEHKLCRHKQRFGKINTTVVLNKDETLLWSGLQWHRSCHGNEMTPLPILLAAVYLGSGNCSSKIVY